MNTEIFATFGPSCSSREVLKNMIYAGMTGMRLNLSHTTLLESKAYLHAYQKAAGEVGVTPQILIDMQGPELRVGLLTHPLPLQKGQLISLGEPGIPVPPQILASVKPGDHLLLDDGKIQMKVTVCNKNSLQAEVTQSGGTIWKKSSGTHRIVVLSCGTLL